MPNPHRAPRRGARRAGGRRAGQSTQGSVSRRRVARAPRTADHAAALGEGAVRRRERRRDTRRPGSRSARASTRSRASSATCSTSRARSAASSSSTSGPSTSRASRATPIGTPPAHAAHAKHIAIVHTGALVALEVPGDATRLRQVLDNLLSNAVEVQRARRHDHRGDRAARAVHVVIEVADTGRGIAPEFMARIFEPFQARPTTLLTRHDGGLGLGLAISQQLAELHEGTLLASSPARVTGRRHEAHAHVAGRHRATRLDTAPTFGLPSTPRLDRAAIPLVDRRRSPRPRGRSPCCSRSCRCRRPDRRFGGERARERIATIAPDLVHLHDIAMPDRGSATASSASCAHDRQPRAGRDRADRLCHAMEADAARALAAGFDRPPRQADRLRAPRREVREAVDERSSAPTP